MTKKERQLIRQAIRLIHQECNYEDGMDILADLAGLDRSMRDIMDQAGTVSALEVAARPNTDFNVHDPKA
jgi:hypothetical protein